MSSVYFSILCISIQYFSISPSLTGGGVSCVTGGISSDRGVSPCLGTAVWETGNYCGKPHVYVGSGGCPRAGVVSVMSAWVSLLD